MTYYTVCPDCGYKLLKASDGSEIEIYCPKCKAKLQISIKDGIADSPTAATQPHKTIPHCLPCILLCSYLQ